MRQRNVPHRHIAFQAGGKVSGALSISELEMWVKWHGLCAPSDVRTLTDEGYIDAAGELTDKAKTYLEAIAKEDE